jgi:hypothetical protein
LATEFSFSFNAEQLKQGPKKLDRDLERAMYATVRFHDAGAEAYMKHNAPWKDRTTNARNGLRAKGVKLGKKLYALLLTHSVTYGIYLELGTKFMHKRPIIVPTLKLYGPKVMKTFNKILDRL